MESLRVKKAKKICREDSKFYKEIEKENEKWFELLTEGKLEKEIEFYDVAEDSVSIPLAIMEYRRLEMDKGREQNITLEQLQKANMNNEKILQELLQEMFLEPIPMEHIEYFYKTAVERGYQNTTDAIEELYRRHKEDKGTRFLSIANTI